MSLTLDQVARIASLARIALDEGEAPAVQARLNEVLALIDRMQAVDTAGIEPMAHALDVVQRLREDAVVEADRHAEYQGLAPAVEAGLYLVPKVLE